MLKFSPMVFFPLSREIEMIPWEEWIQSLTITVVKSSPYEPFLRNTFNGFHGNRIMRIFHQKWIHQETN